MNSAQGAPDGVRGPSTVRVLHASDLHVEGPDDAAHIARLGTVAAARRVDLLLIVGDFFDHSRVSDETVRAVAGELGRVGVPVVVLPGNHDPIVPGSPYERADPGPRVHVLTGVDGETYDVPGLDVTIWGRPHVGYDDFRPMADPPPRTASTWQIALAHGHLVRGPADVGRAYPILPEEIERCDRDYVALGHWDLPHDVSQGRTVAAYSGSPSRLGACALVTLALDARGHRTVTAHTLRLDAVGRVVGEDCAVGKACAVGKDCAVGEARAGGVADAADPAAG